MSTLIKVRKFNNDGLLRAAEHITLGDQPYLAYNWLRLDEYTSPVSIDVEIDLDFEFNDKYELAKYLFGKLGDIPEEDKAESGFWTWLCFLYLDKLVNKKRDGSPDYKALPNYILTWRGPRSHLSYRHRVYEWYRLYENYKEKARFFLSTQEPYAQGATIENISSRNWVVTQHLDLLFDLYYDEENGRVIKGFDNKPPEVGEKKFDGKYRGEGKVRRAIKVLQQLDTVYILRKINLEGRKEILGPEFKKPT